MSAAVAVPTVVVFAAAAAVDSTPALKEGEEVRSLLPLRGTAWSTRSIGRRRVWMGMTAVMKPWWPVARQIGPRGGQPGSVGAPSCLVLVSCPGVAIACQRLHVDDQSAIDGSLSRTGLRLRPN